MKKEKNKSGKTMGDRRITVRPVQPQVVKPILTPEEALKQFEEFQKLKVKVLRPGKDTVRIGGELFICKSGWRRIKTMYNISEEILERTCQQRSDKSIIWIYRVRAIAPNGVFCDAEAAASTTEQFFRGKAGRALENEKPENAVMAMAQTRAFNRAISDLIGGGEVSEEEMVEVDVGPAENGGSPHHSSIHDSLKCGECGGKISRQVLEFSARKYGKPLCFVCQQKQKATSTQTE